MAEILLHNHAKTTASTHQRSPAQLPQLLLRNIVYDARLMSYPQLINNVLDKPLYMLRVIPILGGRSFKSPELPLPFGVDRFQRFHD